MYGGSVIMCAVYHGRYDIFEFLARNKRADLSIVDNEGINVYTVVDATPVLDIVTSQEQKDKMYRLLEDNGVSSAAIDKGFRSPLSSIEDSLLRPKRLAKEVCGNRFYIHALTISLFDLEVEAKERCDDEYGRNPIISATGWEGMKPVLERQQRAWPGSVNAKDKGDVAAIMTVAANQHICSYSRYHRLFLGEC
jgi:hypothetical protein